MFTDEMNRRADVLADKLNDVLATEGSITIGDGIAALMKLNCRGVNELYGRKAAEELMELLVEANVEIFARYAPTGNYAQADRDPEEPALVSLVKVLPKTKWKAKAARAR